MIYRILLLRALDGQADTNDIEQLKHAINHVSVPSDLTNLLNNQNGNVLYQPAMLQGINPQQKVDVIDLTSNFGVDKNLSKKDLSKYIQSLVGVSVSSADKKAILNFVTRSKRTGKPNVYVPDHIAGSSKVETVYKDERKSLVNNIVDLIEKSVLIEVAPNNDRKHKPNVDNYLRFYVPVQIGSDVYTVRIVAENNQKKDLFNIKSGNVYDVIIDKKMPTSSTLKNNSSNSLMKSASDNSISDTDNTFNPQQITIAEMLKNVIGADNNVYFQPGYHGSAAKFDKFDDDFIGSGEGAQVHGYGHYVAASESVADERYRERFIDSRPMIEVDGDVYVGNDDNSWSSQDGQEYWDSDSYYGELLSAFYRTEDKNEAIDIIQSELDELLEERKKVIEENNLNAELLELNDDDGYVNDNGADYVDSLDDDVVSDLNEDIDRIVVYKKAINVLKNNDIKMYQGQLYQVEIPDDDVLLDEDNLLSEQEDNIQEKIKKVAQQIYQDRLNFNINTINSREFELINNVKDNKFFVQGTDCTGRDFYKSLAKILGSDKKTSLLLNEYGIKGIKYNGNVDGDCFVVFDPQNIEITKTFYQADFNADKKVFDKQKYLIDEKVYDNFIKIHKDLNKIEKSPEYWNGETVEDAEKYLGFKDDKGIKIQSPIEQISIYKSHLEHLINDNNAYRKKYLNRTISTIKSPNIILKNGDYNNYIKLFYDEKNNVKPHLQIVKVKSDGSFYVTNFKPTKQQIKSSILEGHIIYDVSSVSDIKNTDISSISDNSSKNNPKRVGYVFEQPDELQPNLFVNNASERLDGLDTNNEENLYVEPRGPKGYRGRAVLDKNLILVTATGDVTTVVHEYAHWFLDMLENFEGTSDKLDDKLFEVRKYLKNDGSPFTREQHEKFAKSFENYIYRGTAKNSKLREIYEDIKNLLHEIYENILKGEYFIGGDNPLSEQDMANANAVFDELFKLEHKNLQERVFKKIDDCATFAVTGNENNSSNEPMNTGLPRKSEIFSQ